MNQKKFHKPTCSHLNKNRRELFFDFCPKDLRVSHMYLNDFKIKNFNSSKKFMQVPLKVNKVYFCYIKNGLTMTFGFFFSKSKNYAIPINGLQYTWSRRAMDKGKSAAIVTKFSEKFAIIMLIWMPHPFLNNRSDTYGDTL